MVKQCKGCFRNFYTGNPKTKYCMSCFFVLTHKPWTFFSIVRYRMWDKLYHFACAHNKTAGYSYSTKKKFWRKFQNLTVHRSMAVTQKLKEQKIFR